MLFANSSIGSSTPNGKAENRVKIPQIQAFLAKNLKKWQFILLKQSPTFENQSSSFGTVKVVL